MLEQLIDRIKNILIAPNETWAAIKAEETSKNAILRNYLLVLAALPAVGSFIGQVIVGTTLPLVGRYRIPFFSGLVWAILMYIFTIIGIYVSAYIVNALATNFGGVKDDLASFKLVAYSYTAPLVGGLLAIVPALYILRVLAGFYGIYLFYLGLPVLMENPKEKTFYYAVVSIVALIVVYIFMLGLSALVLGSKVPHY